MTASPPAADRGLPFERTALAWQRTALSLLGVSVVVARLAVDALGPLVLLAVVPSLVQFAWLFRGTSRRGLGRRRDPDLRRNLDRGHHPDQRPDPDWDRGQRWPTPTASPSVGLQGGLLAGQVLLLAAVEIASLAVSPPT